MNSTALKLEEQIKKKNNFLKMELLDKKRKKNTPLHEFSKRGWIVEVEKIIDKVDLDLRDYYNKTALEIAKENKHLEIIELIENQIENNNKLFKAMESKDFEKMERAIELKANLNLRNENSYMPIHLATFWEDTKALEKLIEMNLDLNATDEKGWTPLMIACNYGKIEHVKLLLKNNVNINVEDKNGWTALEIVEDRVLNIGLDIQEKLNVIAEILKEYKV
jgi:ankyrin repeat protein